MGSGTVHVDVIVGGDSLSKTKVGGMSQGKAVFIADSRTQSSQIQMVLNRIELYSHCCVSMGTVIFAA